MESIGKCLCAFIVAMATLGACSDDESFSSDAYHKLTFSSDTLSLDTVFSLVPTPTKTFWVFNHSGDGIRCSSVRLGKGNQTGFRVNVDGTYLSESMGFQTHNVELRDGDSIRVFVELTSPSNGQIDPQLLTDDLVFLLESGVEQRVALNAWTWDAELLRDVVVRGEDTLQSTRPMVVYGGIRVDSAATLHIPAGQTVYFHAGAGIDVYGTLLCEGEPGRDVVLRGDRIDHMFDYLPYDLVSGQWNGIRFHSSSFDNVLKHTDVHSTFQGIVCYSSTVDKTKLQLLNSTVHNCQGTGLDIQNCYVDVVNCQISNTLGSCVSIYGGNVLLQNATLAQFYPFDSNRGATLTFSNGPGHPLALSCVNSIVTGYADDVVFATQNDTVADYKFLFLSSILRTPQVEDSLRFKNVIWEDPEDTLTTGHKHFRLVDIDTQHYDFHLDSLSTAIAHADPQYATPLDRDGNTRDETPDIGCYEFLPPTKE